MFVLKATDIELAAHNALEYLLVFIVEEVESAVETIVA